MSRVAFTTILLSSASAAFIAFGCSDDTTSAPTDGGPDSSSTAGSSNGGKGNGGSAGKGGGGAGGGTAGTAGKAGAAGNGGSAGSAGKGGNAGSGTVDGGDAGDAAVPDLICGSMTQLECGEYIVKHIDACGDCHTTPNPDGSPNPAKFLAGNPAPIFDLDPTDANCPNDAGSCGLVYPPNLTTLKGIGWTAQDFKNAIFNGQRSAIHGGNIVPVMPYYVFHNMEARHQDAIVAYLMSLAPITNLVPPAEPLPKPLSREGTEPMIPYLDPSKIPDTTLTPTNPHYGDAVLGKYLASELGICIECHTVRTPAGQLDVNKFFAGGEPFGPPFNTTSLNITPADNGIKGWTFADVAATIKTGKDKAGMQLCGPMPFGPLGAFGGMLEDHANAIGYYLTSIPGVENPTNDGGAFPMVTCGAMTDAGRDH